MTIMEKIDMKRAKGRKLNDLLIMGFEKGDNENCLVWKESPEEVPDWCNDIIKVHFEDDKLIVDSIEIYTKRGEEKWNVMVAVMSMDDTMELKEVCK